ncbi:MAG TPA: GGDEF domain-containing protein [Rhizobiaceae bacterium]|nr:GGDEF domain-containing protein [Rhizobiaceae bacterium]
MPPDVLTRLGLTRIATLKRIAALYAIVQIGVEGIVTAYFWNAGWERLSFELIMSFVIVTVVGLPVMAYVAVQHERLKNLTEKLAHLSSVDQMTGLLNRQTFLDRLELTLFEGRGKSCGVFAYLDGDHFKTINDRFGHAVGDKVILLIAGHIRTATRKDDLAARLGGEEFGVFFKGAALEEAAAIAERLRREVELSGLKLGIPGFSISVSIGLAAHRAGEGALETMRDADRSLYAAKHGGRNAIVIELKRYGTG